MPQLPATHVAMEFGADGQTLPHRPQFIVSVRTLAHTLPHKSWPAAQPVSGGMSSTTMSGAASIASSAVSGIRPVSARLTRSGL